MFLVLHGIPISVFLNSLVIVLVSGPKKVKVAHFFFCSLFLFGGFCFCCIVFYGQLLLFSIVFMIVSSFFLFSCVIGHLFIRFTRKCMALCCHADGLSRCV
jgi:hypothetical protein